ncbi:ArsR family transcriptional regulator [Actinoallomurus iriomotensis]|uniref:ArsR family transcriptional regulator n=1 Tax=Actinoallomurus iriomotensis TaxID=478107 RepID=A0A9W6SBX8_9ACTN|nr:ArsR family transcriptional regulator [Actinoallomurus iriomotensis]
MKVKPPDVLALAGHELRWRLLGELARSDRQVHELTDLIGQPQSLVSYHLGRLRAGGLVAARRSSADRREAYYRIDLVRCGELLADAAAALHPGLRPAPPAGEPGVSPTARVLFLCTGNSARSQIAEALLRHHGGEAVEAFSAGSHPKRLHPSAVLVMREQFGIDIAGQRVKSLDEFTGRRFDHVISLCDRLREVCPDFPGAPELIHWSIPDPAAEGEYPAFERTAAELDIRIRFLIHHLASED